MPPQPHSHAIRAAVFDIDGTLAMMDKTTNTYEALPGAVEALEACRARGIPAVAYTNGTFFPPSHYYPLLADAGLAFDPGHILTPAVVAARRLKAMGHQRIMVIGADGTVFPVEDAGLTIVPASPEAGPVDAVLLAWTRDFTLTQLEAAANAVWAGAPVYATSKAPYFAGAKGRLLGVSGAMAAAITNATGVEVEVFGKPSAAGLEIIAALTGVAAENTVVLGDDPKLEIIMARRAGALAIGVTTGVSDVAAFAAFAVDERAQIVVETLEGLMDHPVFAQGETA